MDVVWTEGKCLGLGALAAVGWLGVGTLDYLMLSQPPLLSPQPFVIRLVIRGAIALSLAALVFVFDRPVREWLGRHLGFSLAIILPAALILAVPVLVPPGSPQDEWLSFLVAPTVSAGLALGVSDAIRGLRRPNPSETGYSPGVVVGFGFGVILLLASVILLAVVTLTAREWCNTACYILRATTISLCGLGFGSWLAAMFAGSLGYAIGRRLPRLAKGAPAPNAR